MRILIYIEPYPLRNEADHYRDIAIEFANMLVQGGTEDSLQEYDIRIYSNRETLNRVQEASIAAKRFLLWPERDELELFRSGLTDWTTDGVADWMDLLQGTGRTTSAYQETLETIHRRFEFELIVHWGDNGAVKAFSQQSGVRRIAMSAGCLRMPFMDSITFDTSGAGSQATPAQAPLQALKQTVGKQSWPADVDLKAFTASPGMDPAHALFGAVNFSGSEHLLTRGNARAAILPIQPHDDADFLVDTDFASPEAMIEHVLPVLADNGVVTVLRPDTDCFNRPGGTIEMATAKAAAEKYQDKALWLDPGKEPVSDLQLLSLTDLVVTANSPLGFEALLFDKPVCLLGRAQFAPEGMFIPLNDLAERHFDKQTYQRNARALRSFILRAYLKHKSDAFELNSFLQIVKDTANVALHGKDDPAQMLQLAFERVSTSDVERPLEMLGQRTITLRERPASAQPVKREQQAPEQGLTSLFKRVTGSLQRGFLRTKQSGSDSEHPTQNASIPQKVDKHPLSDNELVTLEQAKALLKNRPKSRRKTAVIAHCYYLDGTRRLIGELHKVDAKFDLFVTAPDFGSKEIRECVEQTYPTATIIRLPNRGRDVWPFCFILSELGLETYDTILKLHTKGTVFEGKRLNEDLGSAWMNYALNCLLGAEDTTDHTKAIFSSTKSWSMAGPEALLAPIDTQQQENALSTRISKTLPETGNYFAGSMFWAKPEVFAQMIEQMADPELYEPGTQNSQSETIEYARQAFGLAANQSGTGIATLNESDGVPNFKIRVGEFDIIETLKQRSAQN